MAEGLYLCNGLDALEVFRAHLGHEQLTASVEMLREVRYKELLTIFSGIPTSIGGLFLTADATLASPEPPESSPARQLQALPTTRDDSIPAS
jgi:hypothetical protein